MKALIRKNLLQIVWLKFDYIYKENLTILYSRRQMAYLKVSEYQKQFFSKTPLPKKRN